MPYVEELEERIRVLEGFPKQQEIMDAFDHAVKVRNWKVTPAKDDPKPTPKSVDVGNESCSKCGRGGVHLKDGLCKKCLYLRERKT
jgi:hypothetical protein